MTNTRQPGALRWCLCASLLLALAACQAAPSADDAGNAAEAEALTLQSAANDLEVRYEAAAALPAEPADLTGGLLTYSPGQLLLGVGPVHIHPDGQGGFATDHEGPATTIIVDDQTRFFADVSRLGEATASGDAVTIQQRVQPVEQPAALPYPAFISIWGEPRDDSFYARVVLFDVPGDEGDSFDEK